MNQNEYEDWWEKEAKKSGLGEDIYYKNYGGIAVKIPKDKLFNKFKANQYKGQNRQGIAQKVSEMISEPDEVWINPNKGKSRLRVVYLKNFEDGWYATVTDSDEKNMSAITWYKINDAVSLGELTKGIPMLIK